MLWTLISKGGEATTREIAAAFLGKDESQLEYDGRSVAPDPQAP